MDGTWRYLHQGNFDDTYTKDLFEAYISISSGVLALDLQDHSNHCRHVAKLTDSIKKHPYRPFLWLERAKSLLKLRLPELAAGDAYKALLLVQGCKSPLWKHRSKVHAELYIWELNQQVGGRTQPDVIASWAELEREIRLTLARSLLFTNSFRECLQLIKSSPEGGRAGILRRAARQGLNEERQYLYTEGYNECDIAEKTAFGSIVWNSYPWVGEHVLRRSDSIITVMRDKLKKESAYQCTIRRSTYAQSDTADIFGIFSRKSLGQNCELFVDRTTLGAAGKLSRCYGCASKLTLDSELATCCKRNFCSHKCMITVQESEGHGYTGHCQDKSVSNLWVTVMNRDFFGGKIEPSERVNLSERVFEDSFAEAQLLQRALSSSIAHYRLSSQDPLKTPLISSLTTSRATKKAQLFSLERDVIWPANLLQQLGVNIFEEHHFDTWVIQVMQAKLRANTWEMKASDSTPICAVSPLYSFFNHSCDPNVKWEHVGETTTLRIRTLRQVRAGEELFISYLDDEGLLLPVRDRQEKLLGWFDHCQCSKCKVEFEEDQEDNEDEESDDGNDEDDEDDEDEYFPDMDE